MTPAPSCAADGGNPAAGRGRSPYGSRVRRGPVQRGGDLLVLGYALASQVELHVWQPDAGILPRLVLVLALAAVLARRRLPRLAPLLCAAGGSVAVTLLDDRSTGIGIVTACIAAGLLGAQGVRGVPALGLVLVGSVVSTALDPVQASDLVTAPLLLGAVAGVAAGLSRARRQADEVRAQIAEIEARSRGEEASRLVEQRARVARELHDVVSQHLTVAALQASGARVSLNSGGRTDAALDALAAAEGAGREALADLRPLLDLMGGLNGLVPQPGVGELPRLVEQVRAAGLDVQVDLPDGLPAELPAGHGLVVYRVVQEALTNALRHGGQHVQLRVSAHGGQVSIDVVNDLPGRPGGAGGGHGLVGMRERVSLYGGTLEAGPHGVSWRVHAQLPLPAPDRVDA
jgi:signal transduction histidine kinase